MKLVAGAGYGGYQKPATLDARWLIHWVRGPRTALRLGLPASRGLGDPAMLLPLAGWHGTCAGTAIGFMPHFESLAHGAWGDAATAAGIELIDPRGNPAGIIAAIGRCRLLLSEAMHGAIVADALRVPWVALRPLAPVHRAKWGDWADALGVEVVFQPLAASSLSEWLYASGVGAWHRGRRMLRLASPSLECCRFVHAAAGALSRAARAPPQLSRAAALDRCQSRMLERLDALRREPLRVE
jgi:succinoglycan biosynthesis protein ExoV